MYIEERARAVFRIYLNCKINNIYTHTRMLMLYYYMCMCM